MSTVRAARRLARRPALSATERAYEAIKRDIIATRVKPGSPLAVDRYVRELGLSRTPVREAVLRLAKEGFVEIRPRMGTFVSHPDLRQIHEMYEVRCALEALAVRQAAVLAPLRDLEELRGELVALTGSPDLRAVSDAGHRVHRLIVDCCGNQVLARMILSLQDHFARFRSLSMSIPAKVEASHWEHLEIVDALLARDAARAERLVKNHFQHAARSLVENLLHSTRVTVR